VEAQINRFTEDLSNLVSKSAGYLEKASFDLTGDIKYSDTVQDGIEKAISSLDNCIFRLQMMRTRLPRNSQPIEEAEGFVDFSVGCE